MGQGDGVEVEGSVSAVSQPRATAPAPTRPKAPSRALSAMASALGLPEAEVPRAARLLILIFVTSAALAVLKAAQGGVFLAAYDRSAIPRAFAASALSLAAASSVSAAAAARLGPSPLATAGLALSAAALLLTRLLLFLDVPAAPFLVYVVVETICGIVLIQVWSVVSETVDPRSAKRLLPVAGVGGSLAWTTFGLLVPRLVRLVGAAGLLLIAPVLLLGALSLVRAIATFDLAGKPARGGARLGLFEGWKQGLRFVAAVPLMRVALVLSVLALLGEQLMDFLLLAAARDSHASAAEIAGFLGRFHGITAGLSLLLLLGASGRVLARVGAILGLAITPVATVLAAAVALVVPGMIPIVVLRGVDRVLKNAVWTSAMEQTQTPLPVLRRAQSRALIRGVVAPLFYAVAAVGLALIPPGFDLRFLALLTLFMSTITVAVIVVFVRKRYVLALRRAIDDRKLRLEPDVEDAQGARVPIDIEACAALSRELADPDEARALLAAEVLGQAEGPIAARALAVGLLHPSAEVRTEAAEGLARLNEGEHADALAALLGRDPISEVRRACIRALVVLGPPERVRGALEAACSDTDRVVRAIAQVALLRVDDDRGVGSGEALLPLLDPLEPDVCTAALGALGRRAMRDARVRDAVRALLHGENRVLRVEALGAVTRTRTTALLADIGPLLEDSRTAPDVVARLMHWGEGALEVAAESVVATSSLASDEAQESEALPLSRLLSHADPAIRDRAANALIRGRKPLPKDAIAPVLAKELRRAYALEAACAALLARPIGRRADSTPALPPFESVGTVSADLKTEVDLRFRETRRRVLQLLALRESRKLVQIVEVGLRRQTRDVEAQIAELLEVALPGNLARQVVPLFDRLEPAARVEAGRRAGIPIEGYTSTKPADPLGALLALDDPHLRACALAWVDADARALFPEQYAAESALLPVYERMRFLRSVPLFGDLPGEDLRTIAEIVEMVELPAGDFVFRKGDPGDDLFVIVEGRVAIRDGKLEIADLGPREFFGELAVIDHEPRNADAIVLPSGDAQLLRLRGADLGELMARRPQIQEQFLVVLARRLRAVTARVATQ